MNPSDTGDRKNRRYMLFHLWNKVFHEESNMSLEHYLNYVTFDGLEKNEHENSFGDPRPSIVDRFICHRHSFC
jgi:phage-related protein